MVLLIANVDIFPPLCFLIDLACMTLVNVGISYKRGSKKVAPSSIADKGFTVLHSKNYTTRILHICSTKCSRLE